MKSAILEMSNHDISGTGHLIDFVLACCLQRVNQIAYPLVCPSFRHVTLKLGGVDVSPCMGIELLNLVWLCTGSMYHNQAKYCGLNISPSKRWGTPKPLFLKRNVSFSCKNYTVECWIYSHNILHSSVPNHQYIHHTPTWTDWSSQSPNICTQVT